MFLQNLAKEKGKMYEYQYLVGGVLSICVSIYILIKHPRTLALRSLSAFGFVVSLWEFSDYLAERAPDAITAAWYFRIVILTSHLGFPIYLLTVLAIKYRIDKKIFLLISAPAVVQTAIIFYHYFDSYEFFLAEFGWSYRVVSFQFPLVISGIIFVSYLVGIFAVLLSLTKTAMLPLLRRKYAILLISFTCLQAIGTTLTNALLAFDLIDPVFRLGGIIQFLTFLSIWYSLSLKEKKISLSIGEQDFPNVYSSFLTIFFNSVTGSQLGEESFRFAKFTMKSGIEDKVLLDNGRIRFEGTEGLDLADLVNRNLVAFREGHADNYAVDHYLRVLNAVNETLGQRFDEIVKENMGFLAKSDLLYGISGAEFIGTIVKDESLNGLEDIDACLKIYKRILLSIMSEIRTHNVNLQNILSEHYVTRDTQVSDYGEISINRVKERLLREPKDQQLSLAIEAFNSILSRVYEELFSNPYSDIENPLEKLRLVLTLNKDKAVSLGVYPTLLGTLATKIPKAQIHMLYSDYLEELVEEKTRELKEVQENLLKSQRLATIGEAAAMVGHDLRNPLQAIVNVLYLARMQLESLSKGEAEESLDVIEEQVEYMNKIVSDLQDYARPVKPELVEVEPKRLLNETLLAIKIPKTVKVSVDVEENATVFLTDSYLLKRVFTNLIINAIQAMPDGGRLSIKVSGTSEEVFFRFEDTGVGIPEENLNKMFQPLFTTKAKGQGLGLAVCKRLVEALNGSITIDSVVGEGTTFIVKISRGAKKADEVLSPQMAHLNS